MSWRPSDAAVVTALAGIATAALVFLLAGRVEPGPATGIHCVTLAGVFRLACGRAP
jgi:hypothetical protein